MILVHFVRACYLLAACCWLAKPSGYTLDTKEGDKTKTGSTSSVTLALTLAPTAGDEWPSCVQ